MDSITKDIHEIARLRARYRSEFMAQFGLRGCHANYIAELSKEPGISQEQLAKRVFADKSSVARQIAALEEAGYVSRESDDADRRVFRVYPTEKALGLLSEIFKKQEIWDSYVTDGISDDELMAAKTVLERIKRRSLAFEEAAK